MSLLNQVLQDLEKRNADNSNIMQDSTLLEQVKAAKPKSKNNYSLVAALLFVVSASYGAYLLLPSKVEPPLAKAPTKTFTKKPVIAQTIANPSIQSEAQKPTTIETAKKVAVLKKPVPVNKPAPKKPSKKIATIITTRPKADYFFTKAKKSQSLLEQQALLNKTIALNAKHLNAHLLLANNLLRQGLTTGAITALQNSLTIFPGNITLINSLAQLYLQSKQVSLALDTLLKINPVNTQNETFLSLLAATYQQDNDAKNSSIIYQKLIHINSDKAEYWLGLAMAFEKLQKTTHAKKAYQHALNKNSLKPNIVSYIKQRIAQLN